VLIALWPLASRRVRGRTRARHDVDDPGRGDSRLASRVQLASVELGDLPRVLGQRRRRAPKAFNILPTCRSSPLLIWVQGFEAWPSGQAADPRHHAELRRCAARGHDAGAWRPVGAAACLGPTGPARGAARLLMARRCRPYVMQTRPAGAGRACWPRVTTAFVQMSAWCRATTPATARFYDSFATNSANGPAGDMNVNPGFDHRPTSIPLARAWLKSCRERRHPVCGRPTD